MKKIFTLLLVLTSLVGFSQSTTLVISQFYGAGGNTGASLNADYVELHNVSGAAISLSGYSIQYSSATSVTAWTGVSPLPATASIPAGGYYLIQMGSAGANGSPLPTADYFATPTIALGGTSGKLALVNGLTAISGCPFPSNVIDGVGYGTANCYEGTAGTAVLTVTDAGFRNNNGCTDTDNNGSDFTVAPAAPRNSASPVFICSTSTNPTITAGTVTDFGSVVILTNSPSQSFNISGSNLTGAPGVITINAPSIDFQVSNDNSSWAASTTIPYTSATLPATPVYVRFTPQTVGPKSGNINILGGGIATVVTVAVSGNGIAAAGPTISASPNPVDFGSVCLNVAAGPNPVTINGTNLTAADLVLGPLSGYTFSTTSGGTYTATLTLPHPAGASTTNIFVQFTPTTATSYSGNIPVTGGGLVTAGNIAVTGSGSSGTATVVSGSPSAITEVSATLAGTLSSQGCSPVTAYGFEYSLTSGFPGGTGIVAASTNLSGVDFSAAIAGLQPGTTYYYMAFATNTGGTVYGTQLSFITSAPPPSTFAATALSSFGSTCVSVPVGPNSFDISGVNLTTADIVIGPLTGYTFATAAGGPFTNSLTLTQPGGTYAQSIYVIFNPDALGQYDGNIPVTGGGVSGFSVPVFGTGENTAPVVITGDATGITANEAITGGSITNTGCSPVYEYGIEYSGINGFVNGSGTKVQSTDLSGTDFTTKLTGLVAGATYYYKAYVVNNGGTSYGQQNSFTTKSVPEGLVIYSNPITRGQALHFTVKNGKEALQPGHYYVMIQNSAGQRVLQRDFYVQLGFIDYTFTFPMSLSGGVYNLQIRNYNGYKIQKPFLVH